MPRLNLSRSRSSKELLASGGTASGPVSFMRGADASAGTIKSGGATSGPRGYWCSTSTTPTSRSSCKTKAKEEAKIRVLRDAGFDMDLGGSDASVQYQNANNSVRVTDEFMHAVEAGGEFGLRARQTGEVIDSVDAESCSAASRRRPGSAPTRASSTTARSTTGTPARSRAGSPRPTRAASTCADAPAATWPR